MSSTTPVASLPYADLTDAPDANTMSENLANALDHIVVPKYTSTSNRDSANGSPTAGDIAFISGTTPPMFTYYVSGGWHEVWLGGAWKAWTPTWSTSSGSGLPSIGNGQFDCAYTRLGTTCLFRFRLVAGTTTNFGSGSTGDNYTWSLPVAAKDNSTYQPMGHAMIVTGQTGTSHAPGLCAIAGYGTDVFAIDVTGADSYGGGGGGTTSGFIDKVTPSTFQNNTSGPTIYCAGFYECA